MWPTCLTRRKRPSSSRRPPLLRKPNASREPKGVVTAAPGRRRSVARSKQPSADPDENGGGSDERRLGRTQMKDRISIDGRDGTFNAYIVRPKTLPASTVVVLQEHRHP